MPTKNYAIQAYRVAARYKSQRDAEADMFRQVINDLQTAREAGFVKQVKAVADNRRLWMTVQAVITDPANVLPAELRALVVSLSLTLQREMNSEHPDLDFLISVNETVAAGLAAEITSRGVYSPKLPVQPGA